MRSTPSILLAALALLLGGPVASGDLQELGAVPSDGARVILVRHAQALSNLSPRPDLSPEELDHLTEKGQEQARIVGQVLQTLQVDAIRTSPAQRAIETGEIVAAALELESQVETGVRPLQLGTARDGSPLSWSQRQAQWRSGKDPRPPAGESIADVGERVRQVVVAARDTHPGGVVILVAHSEVIGAFVGLVQGTPAPERIDAVKVSNASLTVVDVDDSGQITLEVVGHRPDGT